MEHQRNGGLKHESRELTEGAERAPARAYFHAVGLSDEDLDTKPLIGVASTWNEFSPCQANLAQVGEQVKQGIRAAAASPWSSPPSRSPTASPWGPRG